MTFLEKIQIFLDLQISVGYLFISILIFGVYLIIDDYFKRCKIDQLEYEIIQLKSRRYMISSEEEIVIFPKLNKGG